MNYETLISEINKKIGILNKIDEDHKELSSQDILNDFLTFNACCKSLVYSMQGIEEYINNGLGKNYNEKYLKFSGLFNLLMLQQDAIDFLYKINERYYKFKFGFEEIRNLNYTISLHPDNNKFGMPFMLMESLNNETFEIIRMPQSFNHNPETINYKEKIISHLEELSSCLDEIIEWYQKKDIQG